MTETSHKTPQQGYQLRKESVTATTGAIAASITMKNWGRLLSVSSKFDSAPSTSENFTVTLDANAGATYDATLYSVDPSATSVSSIVWQPDADLLLERGDQVDVAFANTDDRTYGVQITVEESL